MRQLRVCVIWCVVAACMSAGGIACFLVRPVYGMLASLAVAFVGWSFVLTLWVERSSRIAWMKRVGDDTGYREQISQHDEVRTLQALISQLVRERQLFRSAIVDRGMEVEDLSSALGSICAHARRVLPVRGVEILLSAGGEDSVHSGLYVGEPLPQDGEQGSTVDIDRRPIRFAGEQIGILELLTTRILSQPERELADFIAQAAGVAVLNARYSEELIRMKRESEASVKAKTGFLATLSHELRGPLGIILNATEIVLDGICGPLLSEQSETLNMVKVNSGHLLDLMNDVLDYAKAEAGKVKPKPEVLSVAELLKQTTAMVRTQADTKKHRLELQPVASNLFVSVDKRHIRQIMINLLTNAVKYTPNNGSVTISAERASHGRVRLLVRDSGVGIPHEAQSRVFLPFERVESGYAATQCGTGLGLPLTKKLVELNGGTIELESEPSVGSVFAVILPRAEAVQAVPQPAPQPAAPKGNGERVLLLVENPEESTIVDRYLRSLGFLVDRPEADQQGIIEAPSDTRLLIVGEDGKATRAALTQIVEAAHGVPTIIITSNAFTSDVEEYIRLGFVRCVPRPVQLQELGQACVDLVSASDAPTFG
jgi:signal transduction histidine kinase/CheY-like chemotaxis protein